MMLVPVHHLQQVKNRERELSFSKVRAKTFAGFFLGARDVEAVVVDLVSGSEFQTVNLHCSDHFGARLAYKCPQLCSNGEQGGCLHFDNLKVFANRQIQVVPALRLQDFTGANIRCRVSDPAAYLAVWKRGRQLHSMGEQTVAEQDGQGIAPFGIDGRLLTPHIGAVHDVVVHESSEVDEFQDYGQIDMTGADISSSCAGE